MSKPALKKITENCNLNKCWTPWVGSYALTYPLTCEHTNYSGRHYGEWYAGEKEIVRSQQKSGMTHFHGYATVSIAHDDQSYVVAVRFENWKPVSPRFIWIIVNMVQCKRAASIEEVTRFNWSSNQLCSIDRQIIPTLPTSCLLRETQTILYLYQHPKTWRRLLWHLHTRSLSRRIIDCFQTRKSITKRVSTIRQPIICPKFILKSISWLTRKFFPYLFQSLLLYLPKFSFIDVPYYLGSWSCPSRLSQQVPQLEKLKPVYKQ